MKTVYLPTRRELTLRLEERRKEGFICPRVRLACKCNHNYRQDEDASYRKANQRNGVIVIEGGKIVETLIKCKRCSGNAGNMART